MDQIIDIVVSWQFVLISLVVLCVMTVLGRLGKWLWSLKKKSIRRVMVYLNVLTPWMPWALGAGLGAIPQMPRPAPLQDVHWAVMMVVGLAAGGIYERVWKGIRQVAESRGIDLDLDDTPNKQS
jgi:hypothetical protein